MVLPAELTPARALVRSLVLPGQRRVHMKKENEPRKRAIADAIVASGITATVYDAGPSGRDEPGARARCLSALIGDLVAAKADRLVLEQDDFPAQLRQSAASN